VNTDNSVSVQYMDKFEENAYLTSKMPYTAHISALLVKFQEPYGRINIFMKQTYRFLKFNFVYKSDTNVTKPYTLTFS